MHSQESTINRKKISLVKIFVLLIIFTFLVCSVYIKVQASISRDNLRANNYYSSAEKSFLNYDLESAEISIKNAIKIRNKDKQFIDLLNKIITARTSMDLINEAEDLIESGSEQDAVVLLNKVRSEELGLNEKANQLKESLRSIVLEQSERLAQLAISSKKYDEAREILNQFNSLYGKDEIISEKIILVSKLEKKDREVALSRLVKKYDKFQDTTWYYSPSSPRYRNTNGFYIYFGVSDSYKSSIRLVVQYESSDWLFIDSAVVNVDGDNYSIEGKWERDHNSRIWEWIDEPLDDRDMIEAIINSKSATIKFNGEQYYDTRNITSSQKLGLRDVLFAYDGFRG